MDNIELIQEHNYEDWLIALDQDTKWRPNISEDFLECQLHLLSQIPLIKNNTGKYDATLMLTELKKQDINVVRLISFLYRCNRSNMIKSQTAQPRLGSLTPLVLYAHKLYNRVEYNEWDKKSPHIKFFLGRPLECILQVTTPITLTHDFVIELRKEALGEGATTGYRIKKFTYNKINYSSMTVLGRMLLQTWLANVSIRNEESMILDPWDWEKVPEAVDEVGSDVNNWDII